MVIKMQTVSIGYDHILAVKEDGTLWGWGKNDHGQLGVGDQKARYSPVKILDQVVSVYAGNGNSFAIREDDSLWGWGT